MEKIPRLRKHLGIIIEPTKLSAKGRRILEKKKSQAFSPESSLTRIRMLEGLEPRTPEFRNTK